MAEPMLDRGAFRKVLRVPCVMAVPSDIHSLTKALGKQALFHRHRFAAVQPLANDAQQRKAILLSSEGVLAATQRNLALGEYEVALEYEHFSADEALKAMLPADVEAPSSFETVGHLAHLNLRAEHEPFKRRIAQIILDKSPNVKTVVNKTGDIVNTFRTFPMEVLGGEPNYDVEVKTHGLMFRFNYANVYWNTRLSDEHQRLVKDRFRMGDVVVDAFCGVGPFAIRAARHGCAVWANDLNPASHAALLVNLALNRVPVAHADSAVHGAVRPFNLDARAFLSLALGAQAHWSAAGHCHVVLNLPASAPEFLDALRDYPAGTRVHCYAFAPPENPEDAVMARVRGALAGRHVTEVDVQPVRDVAPKKLMMCAHFVLGERSDSVSDEDVNLKRIKR